MNVGVVKENVNMDIQIDFIDKSFFLFKNIYFSSRKIQYYELISDKYEPTNNIKTIIDLNIKYDKLNQLKEFLLDGYDGKEKFYFEWKIIASSFDLIIPSYAKIDKKPWLLNKENFFINFLYNSNPSNLEEN